MRINKVLLLTFITISIFDTKSVYSQKTPKRSKITKASNYSSSSGLRVNTTIKCAKPGDPACIGSQSSAFLSCGANAQKNSTSTACECIDPVNYIINVNNPNECIQKTDSFAVAQKKSCGQILINAIAKECEQSRFNQGIGNNGTLKCYDANDLFLNFDTSEIKVYIEGVSYDYDKVCYMFTEDLTKSIAEDYAITGPNSLNCKLKRAIAEASNECFQAVLSTGKATKAVESIELKLQNMCGIAGLRSKWNKLYGDESSDGVIFPTDIPQNYINAGKLSAAHGSELIGNFLDGKMTDKSNTWELEITMLLNSHLKEVGLACGQEYAVSEHNTNIQLTNEKSSLQRAIDEHGALKGGQIWALNQASTIVGENTTNKIIREGVFGGTKDKDNNSDKIEIIELNDTETISEDKIDTKLKEIINNIPSGTTRYLILTQKDYKFLDTTKETNDAEEITYTTINYKDDMEISGQTLKKMLNKTENLTFTTTAKKLTK